MSRLKLFPLGLVAYPTKIIPLHIFEERYKTLINECIDSKKEFGMVYSMDSGFSDVGCSLSVSDVVKTYPNGELDIITRGERIFKIESNKIENDLNIGRVEFQKDKVESIPALVTGLGIVSSSFLTRNLRRKKLLTKILYIEKGNFLYLIFL